MKISKRTRTLAVLTAASMLTSFVTTVPAMGAEAEGKMSALLWMTGRKL